jgi:hypothetical protein
LMPWQICAGTLLSPPQHERLVDRGTRAHGTMCLCGHGDVVPPHLSAVLLVLCMIRRQIQ